MTSFSRLLPLLGVFGLVLGGCNLLPQPQADAVRYFTLSPSVGTAPVADAAVVRRVQLAAHLRARQMAVRVAEHEVIYLDDITWAEPLDDAILGVLRARLSGIGGGAAVAVQVQRCELVRARGNVVELAASYTITPASGDRAAARHGVFTAPARVWDGKDYAGLVGLISQAVDELAGSLAGAAAETR